MQVSGNDPHSDTEGVCAQIQSALKAVVNWLGRCVTWLRCCKGSVAATDELGRRSVVPLPETHHTDGEGEIKSSAALPQQTHIPASEVTPSSEPHKRDVVGGKRIDVGAPLRPLGIEISVHKDLSNAYGLTEKSVHSIQIEAAKRTPEQQKGHITVCVLNMQRRNAENALHDLLLGALYNVDFNQCYKILIRETDLNSGHAQKTFANLTRNKEMTPTETAHFFQILMDARALEAAYTKTVCDFFDKNQYIPAA